MAAEKSSVTTKGQAWFCTTGLPSDVVVEVDDMTFHLHKFPLMSKSKKLHDLIKEQESKQTSKPQPQPQPSSSTHKGKQIAEKEADLDNDDDDDNNDDDVSEHEQCHVSLSSFPGGSETFEAAAKFCYGVKVSLTASKVAPLRCAGEVLEMTEEYAEENLISKTERYLTQSVLRNIKDSIKALKSCERLPSLALTLGIVDRCIDAISSKASLYDPSLFGWPVHEPGPTQKAVKDSSWIEELAKLSNEYFYKVISSMREKQLNPEIIETCLIQYAKRCFPGVTRSNRKPALSSSTSTSTMSTSTIASESEQREVLERIVSNIPTEKRSRSSTSSPAKTRFLFGLLRTANILNASRECKSVLEKKIGEQLEEATLDDVLIPSYSYLNETLYDVECVERILGHFLDTYNNNKERDQIEFDEGEGDGDGGRRVIGNVRSPAMMLVGKLIDGYLSEIASDGNLKPNKFCELAVSLPEQARLYDDGVYRAVDVYLKAHPWITEEEREKICGVMDCQKLTLEACTHAAQNERLPLRAVVQVLFFEQLQLRHAIAGTLIAASPSIHGFNDNNPHDDVAATEEEEERDSEDTVVPRPTQENGTTTWRAAVRENQVLRLDMDSMRTRVHELERECSTMKKVIEKFDHNNNKVGSPIHNVKTWKSSLTRKFGCKFKTQVCDSHESTVVEARKSRQHHRNQR